LIKKLCTIININVLGHCFFNTCFIEKSVWNSFPTINTLTGVVIFTGEELPEYHKENVHKEVPFDTLGFDDGDSGPSAENGDVESPFEKLRNVMENITEDGGVKKKILKEGIGEKVPLNVEVTGECFQFALKCE